MNDSEFTLKFLSMFARLITAVALMWFAWIAFRFIEPAYKIADALDRIAQAEHIKVAGRDRVKDVFNRRDGT